MLMRLDQARIRLPARVPSCLHLARGTNLNPTHQQLGAMRDHRILVGKAYFEQKNWCLGGFVPRWVYPIEVFHPFLGSTGEQHILASRK